MPLPTAPVKLGNLLPSEEYKAKARPARSSKKQASDGDLVETETDFGASVGASRPAAANTANTLRAIASETLANAAKGSAVEASDAAPAARTRRAKQTAALLQPAAAPAEQVETTPAVARTPVEARAPSRSEAPAAPVTAATQPRGQQKRRQRGQPENEIGKLFVLDTNVLMHDPSSLFRFEEHDVYLPMMTLEELDNHKKGMSEVARNARQVSRTLDALVAHVGEMSAGCRCPRWAIATPRDACTSRPR
jgi:PhoH-like ATPase